MFFPAQKGSILILALVVLAALVFLGSAFLNSSTIGFQMTKAQTAGITAYYLAEAGSQEAIFKLKNDVVWKAAFETKSTPQDPLCSSWSITDMEREDVFSGGAGYEVSVNNLGCARAEIVSIGYALGPSGAKSKRTVKILVFKPLGNFLSSYSLFGGDPSGDIVVSSVSPMNIHSGDLFSNNDLRVKTNSALYADNKILTAGNILVDGSSQLSATSCSANRCDGDCVAALECPPSMIDMPSLDFDSASSSSYLSRAQSGDCSSFRIDNETDCVFSPEEFEKTMWAFYPVFSITASSTIYITGDFNLRAGQIFSLNGALAADGNINLGRDYCWVRLEPPFLRCGNSRLTLIRSGSIPAGLLAKGKIEAGGMLGVGGKALDVNGLVYAGDEIKFSSVSSPIVIRGSVAGRKLSFSSLQDGFDVFLDKSVISSILTDTSYALVISADHWEEEY
ncbi:MAG: hypothetical protein M1127_02400 [Patescibacteria group bacterium]|nr:hypothetical protein [Patescibacteria group bacterium]